MADGPISFTGINLPVCYYCANLVRAERRDGYDEGCGLRRNDEGRYARVKTEGSIDCVASVSGWRGCEQFEPSGLPVHPQILERLLTRNPRCSKIPVDQSATETSWEFSDKMNKHLPLTSIVSYEDIQ